MKSQPGGIAAVLSSFSHLFTLLTWAHVQILLMGAILCQGARRVSSILRVMAYRKKSALKNIIVSLIGQSGAAWRVQKFYWDY